MGKYIVHCNTYNKAKILCGMCGGFRIDLWARYGSKTCYRVYDYLIQGWDNLDSYKDFINRDKYRGYVIVTFEEFMERENLTNEMVVD